MSHRLDVRDARVEDLAALMALRYADSPAIHRDRIRDADNENLRYLLVVCDGEIIGFGMVILGSPPSWPEPVDADKLPAMNDLFVREDLRGRGIGTFLIDRIERIAAQRGFRAMHLAVQPENNAPAHRLYLNLGYEPLQNEPREDRWEFTDSDGNVHRGVEWIVDMQKPLA